MMLEASVVPCNFPARPTSPHQLESSRRFVATALNDAVISAGPPFHMIELQIAAEADAGVRYYGDGVIVYTPSGSTAYNVSAGGPIINPDVECFGITPICPHSLSFRPVVVAGSAVISITASVVNPGTTLFCDGQASTALAAGEHVIVRRAPHDLLIVENPASRGWRNLAQKLNWAVQPQYNAQPQPDPQPSCKPTP
jgi:NAD+ kinase